MCLDIFNLKSKLFSFYTWLGQNFKMTLKHDIGWELAEPIGGSKRTTKCKYYGKVIHDSITRLKQHIAHIFG